ncbi:uncharacterized protein LOC115705102 isoform X2 [Cannabis sativa]|uniref:uncharacterized protein LOC115705102 isoform X2 n=1 Tax=Cannabis sativa TaxID=3483 RepID=UPI0029C9E814|nr:uncharacterized protein LOC115705102 isoform X2 [Cannabis sativa]
MAIDKSWITKNRCDDAYWEGVQVFIEFASKHTDSSGKILCPCVRCRNTRRHKLLTVETHIFDKGFESSYQKWIWHGEIDGPLVNGIHEDNEENRKKMQYPTTQGTKSMAERRYEKKNKSNFIETWKEVHTKKSSNTFVNQLAAQKYGELVSAYIKRANTPYARAADEIEMSVLSEVLGERRGHNRGVGKKLKGQSSSRNTQPTLTQDMPMDPRVEQKFEKLTRLMLWMSQRLGPDVRLPTDEELFGMAMPQMSGGGSASSSQPGTSQYHQAQQLPPFMYPLSSPPQIFPFPWMSSPMSQMQVMNMQRTPQTQQMQKHPPQMQQTSQLQQHPPQMQQRPSMQQTSQMQQPSMQQMTSMQKTPQMQQASMQHMSSMQQTPEMHQPSMKTPHMQLSSMQHTPHVQQIQQMTHMHQMSHLQQMPSMQQTPHTPSMPLTQHMAPTSQMQPLSSMQQMSHIQQPNYPQIPEVSQ